MQNLLYIFGMAVLPLLWGGCSTFSDNDQGQKAAPIQVREASSTAPPSEAVEDDFPYDLLNPQRSLQMPGALKEVSAVSWINEDELGLVQDERGRVYVYSLSQAKVTHFCDFTGDGDFEGLVVREDSAFILRSDGRIYIAPDIRKAQSNNRRIKTFLGDDDDTEGLAFDEQNNALLIACKEPPEIGGERVKNVRSIYRFDIASEQLETEPYLALDMYKVQEVLQAQAGTAAAKELAAEFNPEKKGSFKPSDLAVHPNGEHIYLIASNGKLLVVFDRAGEILYTRHLPRNVFSQPEGIDFAPDGTLYISNEGRDGAASILVFAVRN